MGETAQHETVCKTEGGKIDTVAVVVTYNRKELLLECIEALLKQSRRCDILIIDNHSTDGTGPEIETRYNHIIRPLKQDISKLDRQIKEAKLFYLDTGENLGGAGGFSYGIKAAYYCGYEYIWIMDDDCIPQKEALEEFFHAEGKLNIKYGFLASKVLWKDGSICRTNVQRYPMARRICDFDSEFVRVNYSSFVSMFFKAEIVKELGLPIKEFFIWSDDLEYTRRISLKYPSYLCNRSVVVHKCKGNYGINIAVELPERVNRYRYIYRNDVYVFRREGLKGVAYIVIRDLYHIFKVIVRSKRHRFQKIKTIMMGTWSGIGFQPSIEYVRESN